MAYTNYPYYPNYSNNFNNNYSNAVSNNSIIWVQGEAGAKSYLVAPNNTVQLWDSEAQKIYLKSADASGMPSIRVINYTFDDASDGPKSTAQGFATKEDNYFEIRNRQLKSEI